MWREGIHPGMLGQVAIGAETALEGFWVSWAFLRGWEPPPIHVSLLPRDDAFSDSLSQKADSEASSGPLLDDKASSKNDLQSPTEHISDYGFGGVMGR